MRDLFVLRGLPLSGKTKWCIDNGLMDFRLSVEYFSDILQSKILDIYGNFIKSGNNDKAAHMMLFTALEHRMRLGDTVVIDDNHLNNSYFSKYKEYANKYIYNMFVIDFSEVSISEIMQRDTNNSYRKNDLLAMLEIIKNNPIQLKDIEILQPSEFKKSQRSILDLSKYKRIIHIGDIHSSYWALRKCIKEIKNDEFYIFLGDYIDKGLEHFETLKFLMEIANKKNVVLLEGNHEHNLINFVNNDKLSSKEFSLNTLPKLLDKGFNKNDARKFYKNLKQLFCYKYHGKTILCSHGGFSNMPDINLICANLAIYGCGDYTKTNELAKSFRKNTPINYYQIFGHRNKQDLEICVEERSYVLESKVEQGGYLRVLSLDKSGFKDISVQNKFFLSDEKRANIHELQKLFFSLQDNLDSNNIDNNLILFTKFNKRCRNNSLPSLILIDALKWEVVLRGYPIAFEDRVDANGLSFPLSVFAQDRSNLLYISLFDNKIFTYTKYGLNDDRNLEFFKEILESTINTFQILDLNQEPSNEEKIEDKNKESKNDLLKDILKKYKCTLVFSMSEGTLILQDGIINNELDSNKTILDYYSLLNIAGILQIKVKKLVRNINSKIDFYSFVNSNLLESYLQNHEGFLGLNPVICDSSNNCFSIATYFTNEWKIIEHFIKECKILKKIEPSKWISNDFRKYFYEWFSSKEILFSNIVDIKNAFIVHLKEDYMKD